MRNIPAILLCAVCLAPAARGQLFSDNFSRGTDPGPLTPWQTNANGGNWTVTGGVMKGGTNALASYGFAFITNNFTNFAVQAQFQFPAGAYGGGLGGRLNATSGSHYAVWLYPEDSAGGSNVLKLLRFDSFSGFVLLQQTNLAAVGTGSHTLKLELSGNLINAYLDSNKLLSATDGAYASGSVSLDMWTDSSGYQMIVDNVTVSALPVVANDDAYSTVSGTSLAVAAPGVLANDSGGNGSLSAVLVNSPGHGTLTFNSNGSFSYTPTNNFSGTDSFTYRATDGQSNSTPATVTISVQGTGPLYSDSFSRTTLAPWIAQLGTWAVTNGVLQGGTNLLSSYGIAYLTNSWSNYSVQASIQLPAGAFGAGVDACLNPTTGARYAAWIYPEGSAGGANMLKLIKFQTWTDFSYGGTPSVPMASVSLASVGTSAHTLKLACAGSNIAVFLDGALMISVNDSETPYLSGGIGADFWTDTAGYQVSVDDVLVASWVYSPSFTENFDGVTGPTLPAGWTTSATGAESAWVTRTNAFDTAPNAAFVPDPVSVGTSDLISPSIPLGAGQSRLSFRNNYDLEQASNHPGVAYDGGVLEIKIGAGSFTDILDAGGSFVSGGYNLTISSDYDNPLGGRLAWSGDSGGFVTTLVDLPAAAMDQTIQLRWRCATDHSTGSTGWYIDTISITNCPYASCWNTPPVLPAQSDRTVDELTSLSVNNLATDADSPAQTLTYTLLDAPSGAGITNGIITWTPSEAQGPGTYTITTRVVDNGSPAMSATNSFTVVVNEINSAPALPPQTDRTIFELTPLTVVNTATDTDQPPNTLTYTLLAGPANATISSAGVIAWTPTEAQGPGTNTFTTRVADDGVPSLSATNTFTVVVNESNSPPVLPAQTNRTVAVSRTMVVTNTASDTDIPVNTLTYTLLTGPTNATIDPNTGVITWTPTQEESWITNVITTVVTDYNPLAANAQHLSATNSFTAVAISGPNITLDSTALLTEGCLPTNNVIDAGETVTVLFNLKNVGTDDTTNLVVALLETNGVAAPSGPQPLGVLVAGGAAMGQAFTFTANGTCGSDITPTLQFQDGPANLGTAEVTFTLGHMGMVLTQNFDTVIAPALPSGWTTSASGAAAAWFTTNSLADSAPNVAFSADASSVGINELVSPSFIMPGGLTQLSFQNRYSLESKNATVGYDGGVLEIKIGTNDFVDILAAGGTFVSGAYNTTISPAYNNPLTNRAAWSGDSTNSVSTIVNLPASAAGQLVQLRWRCGSDGGGTSRSGWRIDNIGVSGSVCCANTAPVLPPQANRTVNELAPVTVINTAVDAESPPEVLSYALLEAPTNAVISSDGVIMWTPTEAQGPGVYTFTTRAADNGTPPLSATNSFTITVSEVNSAPMLTVPANQTINELVPWSANATATDTDLPPNTLTFELVSGPSGLTVSPGGAVNWTPTEAQGPSTNTVTVRVYDNGVPSLSATNSFTLTVNEVNSAPMLTVLANQSIKELVPWSANATAIDTDSPPNALTFELVSGPSGLTVSPGGALNWTPTEAQGPSTNTVTVRVYDNGVPSLSATNSFIVTVNEVNSAPQLTVPANQTINELVPWSANVTAIDTDSPPNTLTFELVSGPSGLTVSPGGSVNWTPTEAQGPSTNTVTVRVYDNGVPSLSATNSFTVTVNEVNSAPLLTVPTNQVIADQVVWNANATAIDTDLPPNTLTFELLSGPTGLTVSPAGLISWTPGGTQASSTNTVTVRVFDNGVPVLSDTNNFTVTVLEATNAPAPVIQFVNVSNGVVTISWSAIAGRTYRVQSQGVPNGTNWTDLLPDVLATDSAASYTNAVGGAAQQFYRVYLVP